MDSDGDGSISLEELEINLEGDSQSGSADSVALILEAADTDGSGALDLGEFAASSGRAPSRVRYTVRYSVRAYTEATASQFEERQFEYFVQNEADLGAEIATVEIQSHSDGQPSGVIEDGVVVAAGYEGVEITSGRQFTEVSLTLELSDPSYELDVRQIAAQMGVECQACFVIQSSTDLDSPDSPSEPYLRLVEYRIVARDRGAVAEYEYETVVFFATDQADLGAKVRDVSIESPSGGAAQIVQGGVVVFGDYAQIALTSGERVLEVAALLQVPDRTYAFDIEVITEQMATDCPACFEVTSISLSDSPNPDGSYDLAATYSIVAIDGPTSEEYRTQTVEYFARDMADLGAVLQDLSVTDYAGETLEVVRDQAVVAEGYPAIALSSGRQVVYVSLVLEVDDESYSFNASEVAVQMGDPCPACYALIEAVLDEEVDGDASRAMTVAYGIYSFDKEGALQRANQTILFFATDQADLGAVIVDVTLTSLEEVVEIAEGGVVVYPGYEGSRLSAGQFVTTLELSVLVESSDAVLDMDGIAAQLGLQDCSGCLVVTDTTYGADPGGSGLVEMNVTYTHTLKRRAEAEQYVNASMVFYAANTADLGYRVVDVGVTDNWGTSTELVRDGVSVYGEYAGTAITSGDYTLLVTIVLQIDPEEPFELDFELIAEQMGLNTTASQISLEESVLSDEITGPRSTVDLVVTYSIRSRYRTDSSEAEELTVLYYATDLADLGGPLWSAELVESSGTPVAVVRDGLVVYEDYLGTVLTKGKETTAALLANLVLLADAQVPSALKADVVATLGEEDAFQSNGWIFSLFTQLASTEGSAEMSVADLVFQNFGAEIGEEVAAVLESIRGFYMYEELLGRTLALPDALFLLEALEQQDGAYAAIIGLVERHQDEPAISQILEEVRGVIEAADIQVGELREALSAQPTCQRLAVEAGMLANSEYGALVAALGGEPRAPLTSTGFVVTYDADFAEFAANNSAEWHVTYLAGLLDIPEGGVSILGVAEGSTIVEYRLEVVEPAESDKTAEQLQDEVVAYLLRGEFQPGVPVIDAVVRDQAETADEREIVIIRDGRVAEEAGSYVNASLADDSLFLQVAASLEVNELAAKVETIYRTSSEFCNYQGRYCHCPTGSTLFFGQKDQQIWEEHQEVVLDTSLAYVELAAPAEITLCSSSQYGSDPSPGAAKYCFCNRILPGAGSEPALSEETQGVLDEIR